MDARLAFDTGARNANIPITATGILLREPTRPYVVAVVVDKNQSVAYDIKKPSTHDTAAIARKRGFESAGSVRSVTCSPKSTMSAKMSGRDRILL